MVRPLFGVCIIQAGIAGAIYDEFPDAGQALAVATQQARELGAVRPEFKPDVDGRTWRCETDNWSVTIKRWR